MKKVILHLTIMILLFLLLWVLEAFCLWEINPSVWTTEQRFALVCIWVILSSFVRLGITLGIYGGNYD